MGMVKIVELIIPTIGHQIWLLPFHLTTHQSIKMGRSLDINDYRQ